MSAIFRGVSDCRTCRKFHCILYFANDSELIKLNNVWWSLLILRAVSIDRLLALTLHLRYSTVITVPPVIITAVCLCIVAVTGATLRFWISKWIVIPALIMVLAFLITTLSSLKIFQIVRKHQRQISQQQQSVHQSNTINMLKCRKSAVTVLYVCGLLVIFYLPFGTTMFADTFTRIHINSENFL